MSDILKEKLKIKEKITLEMKTHKIEVSPK